MYNIVIIVIYNIVIIVIYNRFFIVIYNIVIIVIYKIVIIGINNYICIYMLNFYIDFIILYVCSKVWICIISIKRLNEKVLYLKEKNVDWMLVVFIVFEEYFYNSCLKKFLICIIILESLVF